LEAKTGHQTLLIEGKGVNAAMQGVGGEAAGHLFVHNDDARASANFPAARVVYPVHRILVHQEEGVTVPLNAGLQAVGSGYGPVSAPRLSVNEKDSLATLSAKDEPDLHHVWKHKNGECFRFTFNGRRILRHQLSQGGARLSGEIVGGRRVID